MDIIIKNVPNNVDLKVFVKGMNEALHTMFVTADIKYVIMNKEEVNDYVV